MSAITNQWHPDGCFHDICGARDPRANPTPKPGPARAIDKGIGRLVSSPMGWIPVDGRTFGSIRITTTVSEKKYFNQSQRYQGVRSMRKMMVALISIAAMAGTAASAQEVNLTGPYQCVTNCAGPGPATVTQNGWDLNLVNEIGVPSRAWVDWPGHIWVQSWNQGDLFTGRNDDPV
jgi:hypothetical protein